MKKVCILSSVHQAFNARVFHKEAKSLVKAGYEVTLIAQHDKNEVVDGVKILALPKRKNRLWRILNTCGVFRLALKEKADIYHFHDPELLLWGLLLQKLTGKPVVYDVHEYFANTILFKTWIPRFLRKPIAWIFDRIERAMASRLDGIVTVTEPMKKRFSGKWGLCVSICNFPSLDMVDSVSQGSGKKDVEYSIIYTGAIAKAKGFETILESLDLVVGQNPKVRCIILAEAKDIKWLDEEYNRLMDKLIKGGNLKIAGRVPHEDVFQYINASTMGWKPGPLYQEGISTKTLEYMACAKPVVFSDTPLTADIIREANCGILVDPEDAKAHASAILYLLEHPDKAKKMGENGRKAVLDKYNWETESQKLLNLYSELLGGSHV
jgi:glycosyltransferase involved in cell wall biosynthesis